MRLLCLAALLTAALSFGRPVRAAGGGSQKVVMLGDSYCTHPYSRNSRLAARLRKELGLGKKNFRASVRGGTSFYREKGTKGTFVRLLRGLRKDRAVTTVLIIGGVGNDRNHTASQIRNGAGKLHRKLKKLYPNAQICYAAPNWHIRSISWRKKVIINKQVMQKICRYYGWRYLSGCEKVMYGHSEYFEADSHHPNAKGVKEIAKAIARDLNPAASGKTGQKEKLPEEQAESQTETKSKASEAENAASIGDGGSDRELLKSAARAMSAAGK